MISDKRHKALQDYVFQFSGAVRFITDIVNAFALIFVVRFWFPPSELGFCRQIVRFGLLYDCATIPLPLSTIRVTFAFIVPM